MLKNFGWVWRGWGFGRAKELSIKSQHARIVNNGLEPEHHHQNFYKLLNQALNKMLAYNFIMNLDQGNKSQMIQIIVEKVHNNNKSTHFITSYITLSSSMRVTTPKASKPKLPIEPSSTKRAPSPHSPVNKSQARSGKSLSPVKKSPTKQPNNEQLVTKMQRNRERLCNTLDTYTLLIRSNHPIRCLQHNSNISIYCETQQKLLCSNCIFSKLDHKYHKVVPVDKVHEKLERDVEIMQRQIERQVQGIDEVYQRIFVHYEQQQRTAQQAMIKLQKLYQDARIMLDQCEIECKKRVVLQLQKVQLKHESMLAELNFLKNVYKDQYAQIQPINDANFLIYEHVMCSTVVNQGKFSHIKWKAPVNQLHKMEVEECKRIVEVLDLLDRYLRDRIKQGK